jgi:hypothetical protein
VTSLGLRAKSSNTTAYYRPQGNSNNERLHRELHSYLAMYLTPASADSCDPLLKQAECVHISCKREWFKCSPFEVITGLAPKVARGLLPIDPEESMPDFREHIQQYYSVQNEELERLRMQAQQAIANAQASTHTCYDKNSFLMYYRVMKQQLLTVFHSWRNLPDRYSL